MHRDIQGEEEVGALLVCRREKVFPAEVLREGLIVELKPGWNLVLNRIWMCREKA